MSMQSLDHFSTYNANISACIVSAFVILCSSFCYCKALGDIVNMCQLHLHCCLMLLLI